MMYVYKMSEKGDDYTLYTVGFYAPDGTWEPESDYTSSESAAQRTAWLNGAKA